MAQKHHGAKKKTGTSTKTAGSSAKSGTTHHYVVRHGDTLSSIARAHDVKGGWRTLYKENRTVIGADPSHLRVGMRLTY